MKTTKLIALVLAIVLALSLAACGQTKQETPAPTAAPAPAATPPTMMTFIRFPSFPDWPSPYFARGQRSPRRLPGHARPPSQSSPTAFSSRSPALNAATLSSVTSAMAVSASRVKKA